MNRTHEIDALLRTVDAAGSGDDRDDRAAGDLERILATDPDPRGAATTAHPAARRRRRLVLTTGLVAAVTAGLVLLPSPFGGGDDAYATWTAVPAALSPAAAAAAAESCREHQGVRGFDEMYPQLADAVVAVAERRGAWTTVVLGAEGGFVATCTTDDSAGTFSRGMFGSIGVPAVPAPGPRDVVATGLGVGTLGAGDLSVAEGFAGEDVTGVVYRSASRGHVVATVSGGHFALWFPGDELTGASHGVDVEVTYRDGSRETRTLSLT
ncbi:hypothetical protein [Kineococcus sp. SYSU DK004]|uniref:hypothetical protein n=1 Tax=Kineococcus sp. SYSU DK004 TaxID=3383125 RepID=UPI003D7CC461